MASRTSSHLVRRLRRIKLFLCDVDGVLTDGTVWMGKGVEAKQFNIRDGLGLKLLQRNGIKVGWVSRRPSPATQERAADLKIDFLAQSDSGKVKAIEAILKQAGLNWEDVCYVGDDVVDVGALQRAGVSVAVKDAVAEAKAAAAHVTRSCGGRGAVREVVELILKAQRKWESTVDEYAV
jgi:3-deoxy-D-manno-octulosonate 8-phosphate phosphatase (KDO 8-P phosphatase)